MIAHTANDFDKFWHHAAEDLIGQSPTDVGQWQSQDTSGKPEMQMLEVLNVSLDMGFDAQDVASLQQKVKPNLSWAEDHFLERVSGEPLNPPPSEAWWPFAQQGNADHKKAEKFSHTYPERMWPKHAGDIEAAHGELSAHGDWCINKGIRFHYGDLMDVVEMLRRTPMSRQAYLPIWFPEDTGAVHGERVPCTLGYHFQLRNNTIYVTYYIRSCDIVRHMRDDVYMAARLGQWIAEQLPELKIERGQLTMHIANMHCFEGDRAMLKLKVNEYRKQATERMLGMF